MFAIVRQLGFLLALIVVLLAGIGWPHSADHVTRWLSADVLVAAVTFVMALPLETGKLWRSIRRPGPAWLASAINSGVAPLLGFVAGGFLPTELGAGVILAAAVPCTLATAAVWTRRAGGNDAVAFLVTMITNLACFIVVPAWLWLLLDLQVEIDYRRIVIGLFQLLVVPIVAAQILRQWLPLGRQATLHKRALSRIAQLGVLLMVLVGAVRCGEQLQATADRSVLSAGNLAAMILSVIAIHLALVQIGISSARWVGFDREDAIAVAFSGSQKTLMVGSYLALAVSPLAIFPMVAYHAAQLIIDTLIADRWRRGAN
jgi:sodium/bile acid cotransporter 7